MANELRKLASDLYMALVLVVLMAAMAALAPPRAFGASRLIADKIGDVLQSRYLGARVMVDETMDCTLKAEDTTAESIAEISRCDEDLTGSVRCWFQAGGDCRTRFHAWQNAWFPIKRVKPGEKLVRADFQLKPIDVSIGAVREFRGALVSATADLDQLEATQTLTEGGFLVSTSVNRVPDVRRGDPIKIRLVSGDLSLTTAGQASEPGYLNNHMQVMIQKTKRVILGILVADHTVEVKL